MTKHDLDDILRALDASAGAVKESRNMCEGSRHSLTRSRRAADQAMASHAMTVSTLDSLRAQASGNSVDAGDMLENARPDQIKRLLSDIMGAAPDENSGLSGRA